MPKKTHEHKNSVGNPQLMSELARKGAEMYHPPGRLPILNADQQRNIGQLSITDGVYIPREAPEVESSGLGWPASELNPDYIDTTTEPTDGVGWPE